MTTLDSLPTTDSLPFPILRRGNLESSTSECAGDAGWQMVVSKTATQPVDSDIQGLLDPENSDLDSVLSRIQVRLARESGGSLPLAIIELVRNESANPDARSVALEALVTARVPELEDEVMMALAAGLGSRSADVVFTAVSCLSTLPPARRASFRLAVQRIADEFLDLDVQRVAGVFLRAR